MSGTRPGWRASLLFAGLVTACGSGRPERQPADAPTSDGAAGDGSQPGTDASTAPNGPVAVDLITVAGTGCPAATATATAVSLDSTFTVTFDPFQARVGVTAAPTDFRKNCNLNLIVHAPEGFSYAISSGSYHGSASLAAGATAAQLANIFFQGQANSGSISHSLPPGPFIDDWQTTDTTDVASLAFSPCGVQRNLNIDIELRVLAGTSDTTTTTSFAELTPPVTYRVVWQRCSPH